MMNYIECVASGGVEVMEVRQMPVLAPCDDEVLIRVTAAGVNRPDILQRQGYYPAPEGASPVLGLEVAGEVVACGMTVTQWRVGDRVFALVNGGGYAEYAVAPQAQCFAIPEGFTDAQAAGLPEALFTLWHNLWQRARLTAGETLLVHGGSGGIGTFAIQMAVALGITVYATAGSAEKCAACEQLGASKAINYRAQDFVVEIKNLTCGQGVNVILDMVGGDYIQRNFSAAAKEGRIVNIAFMQGSKVRVDFLPLMLKRLTLTGSTLRAQSAETKATIAQALRTHIWPLLKERKVLPVIAAEYPLAEVAAAHRLLESSAAIGKIILVNHSPAR